MIKRKISTVFAIIAAACLMFCSCGDPIDPVSEITTAEALVSDDIPESDAPAAVNITKSAGKFYGSYLTMFLGSNPSEYRTEPYFFCPKSYQEVSDYYDRTYGSYYFGAKFTLLLASFTDDFLAQNDVMILSITEPSSYVNHDAGPVEIDDETVTIKITRHTPKDAPQNSTQFHLVFIGPKGCFDDAEGKELKLSFTDIDDAGGNSAYDAENFRIYYPEFWNFCYRADALTDSPEKVVDIISGYDDLVYFFESYRDSFDLDSEFREDVGTLYNWQICERYVLIATIIPCADEEEPVTSELFVNNLELYMTVDANEAERDPKACYLLLTAVERWDMQGVDLSAMNLLVEQSES